jgi:nitrate/TMAO reductase-like tetraheme cytochrome c subunit
LRNAKQAGRDLLQSDRDASECWKSKRRAANLRPITKFDHGPHMTLLKLNDCQSCHQLGQLDFVSMRKDQCSSCHQADAAGESCTQCHNYHVGKKGWAGNHE